MQNKIIKLTTIAGLIVLLASCKKDIDVLATAEAGKTPATGFGVSNITPITLTIDASTTQVDTALLVFNNAKYGTATSVTIKVDTSLVSAYNASTGSSYDYMPSDVFTFPASISIPANSLQGSGNVSVNITKLLTYGTSFATGFTITAVSGGPGQILTMHSHATLVIQVKNAYDGTYTMNGYTLRSGDPVKTGNFTGASMDLITATANTVNFGSLQIWADGTGVGIGNPVLTVTSTASAPYPVTVSSSGGARNAPGYNSRYDPSTKSFYISYTWGAGPTSRLATDTLTYLQPR